MIHGTDRGWKEEAGPLRESEVRSVGLFVTGIDMAAEKTETLRVRNGRA